MARITVDDCMKRIPNRFELTLAATYRARQIDHGGTPLVEADRTSPPSSRCARSPPARSGWKSSTAARPEAAQRG